jgi:hypothetical protein
MPLMDQADIGLWALAVAVSSASPLDGHRRSSQRAGKNSGQARAFRRESQIEFSLNECARHFLMGESGRMPLQWSECKPDLREGALSVQAPDNITDVMQDER